MPMSEGSVIRGQTIMTWADQARCSVRPVIRSIIIFAIGMTGALLIVWAIHSSDEEWLMLRHEPLHALGAFGRDVWKIFLACFLLLLVLLTCAYVRAFYRLPQPSRQIAYEATKDCLVTSDAADFALTVPWSSVIRVRNSGYIMRMKLAAGIWRFLFWRAFAPEDRDQVLRWARQTGKDLAGRSAASGTSGPAAAGVTAE
jgi:hypothetical protein